VDCAEIFFYPQIKFIVISAPIQKKKLYSVWDCWGAVKPYFMYALKNEIKFDLGVIFFHHN